MQEYLELGLHGWAMSRFSGCAVAFKALADTVESSASIDADPFRVKTLLPEDFVMPEGGLNAGCLSDCVGVQARKQEALMQDYKIYAAMAYARANQLNRTTIDSPNARLGIIASGKSYMDVLEALEELGITEANAAEIGIRLFKVSMPWPLEPDGVREFSKGLEEILVVEEKRQIVEYQLKEQLYNWRHDVRPRVIGKFDEKGEWVHPRGEWLLPAKADFSIAQIARVIAGRIARFHQSDLDQGAAHLPGGQRGGAQEGGRHAAAARRTTARAARTIRSTKVPDGSLALAGIGCHVMATAIYPEQNKTHDAHGRRGRAVDRAGAVLQAQRTSSPISATAPISTPATWPSARRVAANVNITYKILYNDAVAMTGGQPVDGQTSVPMIAQQMAAEGVKRIALVTEDPSALRRSLAAAGACDTLHDRKDLEAVQTRTARISTACRC